ncbi:hypothetical protein LEP1GSC050_4340 [Leptospira broomii serovar Hurstbridge str. 5399]|uniref:Thiol:disulfide interchange protein DsbD N-terminal domain-containing protein n=1 Tax=Leptospira broomii serovar Hurstbridge str. 5399 TaxID=1049789 RepID=T0GBF2_9LEPT|nr:hypothetical protein [Leptospira broomii]EQA44129.1 hypothetical protein LEP1GSC050_4340 [Leptospira broomii serovar Hurstbridge str. 5399]
MKLKLFVLALMLGISFGVTAEEESPVKFKLEKGIGETYFLKIVHPSNFGIQKDAPHKITVSAGPGLKVESADLKLKGKTSSKKKEYFESVDPMAITLKGAGELEIHAKIFYCDYNRNICIPGKIVQKEIIK